MTTHLLRTLVLAASLAVASSCDSTSPPAGDGGLSIDATSTDGRTADPDGAVPAPSPREAQSISAAGGRVTGGGYVLDVEVGYSVSRAAGLGTSHEWESGSPAIP